MTNFIPIFPLAAIAFPGEQLNLHIFEPRYQQLIKECFDQGKPFGLPVVLQNKIQELGTLMNISEITKAYPNGEMDIKTQSLKVFRVLEVIDLVPEKLYMGAIVNYPSNTNHSRESLLKKVLALITRLHHILQVKKEWPPVEEINSYKLAHHAGLNLEQEYELLGLFQELQRLEYLKRHLAKAIPMVFQSEALRKKIKMNGHFRHLKGL